MCPKINKKEIKPKKVKYKNPTDSFYADKYSSPAWKRMRNTYYSQFPVCQECLKRNRVTPTEEIHHIHKWSDGETEEEQWRLFLDWNNLTSCCKECHRGYHIKMDRYGLSSCNDLTDKEWREAHHLEEQE